MSCSCPIILLLWVALLIPHLTGGQQREQTQCSRRWILHREKQNAAAPSTQTGSKDTALLDCANRLPWAASFIICWWGLFSLPASDANTPHSKVEVKTGFWNQVHVNLNPSSARQKSRDLGQVIWPFCSLIPPFRKWVSLYDLLQKAVQGLNNPH